MWVLWMQACQRLTTMLLIKIAFLIIGEQNKECNMSNWIILATIYYCRPNLSLNVCCLTISWPHLFMKIYLPFIQIHFHFKRWSKNIHVGIRMMYFKLIYTLHWPLTVRARIVVWKSLNKIVKMASMISVRILKVIAK